LCEESLEFPEVSVLLDGLRTLLLQAIQWAGSFDVVIHDIQSLIQSCRSFQCSQTL
jgi:hypothetical protein